MSNCVNNLCEGDCVCAELEAFVAEMQGVNIARACRMRMNMFDIGIGRALHDGEKLVNFMIHSPGPYREDDPSMLTMSFGQQETEAVIRLLIKGYREQWGDPGDE